MNGISRNFLFSINSSPHHNLSFYSFYPLITFASFTHSIRLVLSFNYYYFVVVCLYLSMNCFFSRFICLSNREFNHTNCLFLDWHPVVILETNGNERYFFGFIKKKVTITEIDDCCCCKIFLQIYTFIESLSRSSHRTHWINDHLFPHFTYSS